MKSTTNSSNPKKSTAISRQHCKTPSHSISLRKNPNKSYQTMEMSEYSTADQIPNSNNSYINPYLPNTINHNQHQQQYQRNRTLSQFSALNNNQIKPMYSNTNLGSKRSKSKPSLDINQIKSANKKEFFHSLTHDYTPNPTNTMATSNINNQQLSNVGLLEQMIYTIKDKAMNQCKMDYNDMIIYKDELEQSIENLKCKIAKFKADQKDQVKDDAQMQKKINALKNRLKDNRPNPNCDNNNIHKLRSEISNMQRDIDGNRYQTREIGIEIQHVNADLNEMHEYKKKMNKMISDKEKEKENFLPAIKLMKKHVGTLKQKLQAQLRINNEFTNKMSSVVEGGN